MNITYEPDRDFYKLLGVTGTVSSEGIRQAYLKCALRAHPDRDRTNQAATENFQDVQAAYEILKDEVKRARYDKVRIDAIRREDNRKREEESWGRSRNRRRQGQGAPAQAPQQNGQDKYFPYDRRAPKPAPTARPPPGASTAWEEMKRSRAAPRAAGATPQAGAQKANPSAPPRPGTHPTSKAPKKPASQRPGSFAQWAKEQPKTPVTPTKNGYRPNSSTVGDEPRAKTSSYQSARKADPFGPSLDSDGAEAMPQPRQSQPYQAAQGEKTKLFDGVRTGASEEDRGRKPFKDTPAPEQGWSSTGAQRHFWPHPETTSEIPNSKRSESMNAQAGQPLFERKTTETSDSWFASEATTQGGPFTFTAGSETSGSTTPVRKTRSSGHLGRKEAGSPTKKRRPEAAEGFSNAPAPESPNLKFDPNEWTQTFGPQNFIPRSTQRSPVSPVRQTRSTLKKSATTTARPPSKAPRSATVSDDKTSDDGGAGTRRDQPRTTDTPHAPSPNAMDIDSPPPRTSTASTPTPAATSARTTRDVPVEPSKPEWRAGTGAGAKSKDGAKGPAAAAPAPTPLTTQPAVKPTMGGSEDTDEFRATLEELKNVPPFAPQGGGLSSLADLGSSLPFASQPSESLPLKQKKKAARATSNHHPPLEIPAAPLAPVLPSTVGMNGIRPTREILETYVRAFESYQKEWNTYNGIFVAHFTERQRRVSAAAGAQQEQLGATRLRYREQLGWARLRYREQLGWARQDAQVRARWAAACEEHDRRLEQHLAVLEKMGSV